MAQGPHHFTCSICSGMMILQWNHGRFAWKIPGQWRGLASDSESSQQFPTKVTTRRSISFDFFMDIRISSGFLDAQRQWPAEWPRRISYIWSIDIGEAITNAPTNQVSDSLCMIRWCISRYVVCMLFAYGISLGIFFPGDVPGWSEGSRLLEDPSALVISVRTSITLRSFLPRYNRASHSLPNQNILQLRNKKRFSRTAIDSDRPRSTDPAG